MQLPDLRRVGTISLDTETKDERLAADMGSGWPFGAGYICGTSVAYREAGAIRAHYLPIRHPDSANLDPTQVFAWLRDLAASKVRIVTQNGLYDWGWLRTEAGIRMPPGERLEEIGALATMVDENRYQYGLDALCQWRGLPGKDDTLLRQGIEALGLHPHKRKKLIPQNYIWQLPARCVGLYAETDAINTLLLYENLDPILDQEGTRAAYRLECEILPMVLEMRLRGIRIEINAAETARDLLLHKRDAALAALSEKLGRAISMHEIQGKKWLVETFDRLGIKYPCTEKGNPSFTAGKLGWMSQHAHWLPQLIATANKYNKAATDFLQTLIDHTVNGRVHAEINPHRSETNGTKSFRFSYSKPALQQMPSRDEELAPLIRGIFLPEEGEVWLKPDCSQQEFRLVVHYAHQHKVRGAADAVARYRDDADADFHTFAATLTGLDRTSAKAVNFAKIYGAGVKKFAFMIGKLLQEAQRIYAQYDRELPFLRQLSDIYTKRARSKGYITLYDGARRHFDRFAPGGKWKKGAGPCSLEEARERVKDPDHPWYRRGPLYRADTHTALNALIQGSAARHTKLWMRACWREGIVPLLQMHDCLDCSVSSPEQAELVARLGEEAVKLDVPMRVDLKYGRNWGDAKHTWEELHNGVQVRGFIESEIEAREPHNEIEPEPVDNAEPTATSSTAKSVRIDGPPQPITQAERDEINAGLKREGIAPINWEELHGHPPHRDDTDKLEPIAAVSIKGASTGTMPGAAAVEISASKQSPLPPPRGDSSPPLSGNGRAAAGFDSFPESQMSGGKILCPFHDDHSPSLQIYSDGHYHCYACGAHGDIEELPEATQTPQPQTNTDTFKRSTELWNAGKSIRGTLAERYLIEIRKLDLAILPDIDAVLRFHPRCPFGKDNHPCVVALFRDVETDEIAGIHRIALTTSAEKIDRMMLGSWPHPRAIKLRPAGKKLIVGEGIETTIAGGMRAHKAIALWAMGSAIAIGRLPLITGVTKLMILVDRDKNNVGMINADICASRWSGAKRMCVLLCPQRDNADFNDLIGEKRT